MRPLLFRKLALKGRGSVQAALALSRLDPSVTRSAASDARKFIRWQTSRRTATPFRALLERVGDTSRGDVRCCAGFRTPAATSYPRAPEAGESTDLRQLAEMSETAIGAPSASASARACMLAATRVSWRAQTAAAKVVVTTRSRCPHSGQTVQRFPVKIGTTLAGVAKGVSFLDLLDSSADESAMTGSDRSELD